MKQLAIFLLTLIYLCFDKVYGNLILKGPYDILKGHYAKFEDQNNELNFLVANFGDVPYGKKIVAPLYLADPITACDTLKPFDTESKKKPFVLIKRGGDCSFVQKARNAQAAGAAAVIISDNLFEQYDHIIIADDGFGHLVHIPTIFISEKDGNNLIDVQEDAIDQFNKDLILEATFNMYQSEIPDLTLFLLTNHNETSTFIKEFYYYFRQVSEKIDFTPVYQLYACTYCLTHEDAKNHQNCLGNGNYCLHDPDGDGPNNGRDMLYEILRQLCIQDTHSSLDWWTYSSAFAYNCQQSVDIKNCSQTFMEENRIDYQKVQQCVSDSFIQDDNKAEEKLSNRLLDQQKQFLILSGQYLFPGAQINNRTYLGNFEAADVFEMVCASYTDMPSICDNIMKTREDEKVKPTNKNKEKNIIKKATNSHEFVIVLIVISVIFAVCIILAIVYKKIVHKDSQSDSSNMRVNEIVSQYIQYSEQKNEGQTD